MYKLLVETISLQWSQIWKYIQNVHSPSCSLNNVLSFTNKVQNCFTSTKTTTPTINASKSIKHQSTFSKRNTFGERTECLSKADVRHINSQIKGSEKGKDPCHSRCPFIEITFLYKIPSRESRLYQRQNKGHLNLEKSLHGNKKIITGIVRTPPGDQSLVLSSWSRGAEE